MDKFRNEDLREECAIDIARYGKGRRKAWNKYVQMVNEIRLIRKIRDQRPTGKL